MLERVSKMEEGASCNVSQIVLSVHAGTHVDAPYHFMGSDTPTCEQLSLSTLTGRAYVLQIPDEIDLITAEVLEKAHIPPRTRRLLLKTRNSHNWANQNTQFRQDFVAISPSGAQHLAERGIKLVGIDYASVAPFNSQAATHQILLKAGMILIENLDLSEVSQGRYSLYCLPLKIVGADGAPARVILIGV
jgi:arylformamidase